MHKAVTWNTHDELREVGEMVDIRFSPYPR